MSEEREYLPAEQTEQAENPIAEEYLPAEQSWQLVDPSVDETSIDTVAYRNESSQPDAMPPPVSIRTFNFPSDDTTPGGNAPAAVILLTLAQLLYLLVAGTSPPPQTQHLSQAVPSPL